MSAPAFLKTKLLSSIYLVWRKGDFYDSLYCFALSILLKLLAGFTSQITAWRMVEMAIMKVGLLSVKQ